jgi:hypothetical protein
MKTIDQLQQENRNLISNLRGTDGRKETSVLEQIRANEAEIKNLKRAELLANVNAKQGRLRDFARQAWEAEQPETDITTNDGSFHATKVKKYPKLAALKYASGKWENGQLSELRINGNRFYMVRHTDKVRPFDFADFLNLNNIMAQDITLEEFTEIEAKNNAANAEFEEAKKRFEAAKSAIGMSALSYWGLFGQRNAGHVYEYSGNY